MSPTADNKKYATDSRSFGDAVRQDGIHPIFEDSPISSRLRISDVCYYKPGDLNKIGKEGRTSWDSFSYALLMGHSAWMHIEAVQRANRIFDSGKSAPDMLVHELDPDYDVKNLIDEVFRARDRERSLWLIDHYSNIWTDVVGTRGYTGKRAISARPQFSVLFNTGEKKPALDENGLDPSKLDALEESLGSPRT
jgi:hypothetical protein